MNRSLMAVSLCLVSVTMTPAVRAQAVKSSVEVSATTGLPEFRDPKTGRVWTPENVGQGGKPILPEDHAFDPTNQSGALTLILQKAIAKPVGSVPVSAGATVPVVNMENTSLPAVPGQRWQLATYLNNNGGQAVDPSSSATSPTTASSSPARRSWCPRSGRVFAPGSPSWVRGSTTSSTRPRAR
jgi:hypothetical protein